MDVRIYPSTISNEIKVVSSKSISHRALIAASLSNKTSRLYNLLECDDITATILALRKLGATITKHEDYYEVKGIEDINNINILDNTIDCLESGSTLRFLIPLFSLTNQEIIFTGQNRLLERPQTIYEDLFKKQDLFYESNKEYIKIKGAIKPDTFYIDGSISSQFISGLLFVLPLLNKDSYIIIQNDFESKSYVDLTIDTLKSFNISIEYISENKLYIKKNQRYEACTYNIETDYSQVAFFAVLASINNDLSILNISDNSIQGDFEIFNILNKMNVETRIENDKIHIKRSELKAIDIDLSNIPDLGPILCVLMSKASNKAMLYNAKRLRYKESDRINSMQMELEKLGINISSTSDSITIESGSEIKEVDYLYSHNDHRILMSLCILATTLKTPTLIKNIECVKKSYPNFFEDLEKVNVKLEIIDN